MGLSRKIIQVFNREYHVPILAPDYVALLYGELLEVLWLDVADASHHVVQCLHESKVNS